MSDTSICTKCHRTIWLRNAGTDVWTGAPVFRWVSAIGSKPAPIQCPVKTADTGTSHTPKEA